MCVRERESASAFALCVCISKINEETSSDQVTVFWREACDDNVLCEEYGGVDGWVTTN